MGTFKQAQQDYLTGFDPNDLQPAGNCVHVWDRATDTCQLCKRSWDTALWDKPCCGGGLNSALPAQYSGGKWHSIDCDTLKPPLGLDTTPKQTDFRPAGCKKGICTCGSASVGSDRHSSYCDIK